MRQVSRMLMVLSLVGLISGLVLSLVYDYAEPLIQENKERALKRAIFSVFPGGQDYTVETVKGKEIYKALNSSGNLLGYAFTAEGKGYQGTIMLMVGMDPNLETIGGIVVLESQETPGLGGKITEAEFTKQFGELKALPTIELVKNKTPGPGQIRAITGATISSRSVVDILNEEITRLRELRESIGTSNSKD